MMKSLSSFLSFVIALFTLVGVFSTVEAFADPDPFPVYECLKPNVEFWKNVYTQYSSTRGIIHDYSDLSIIYEVIELADRESSGAHEINEMQVRGAKEKYQRILENLARGDPPSSDEERRVSWLFGPNATPDDFQKAKDNLRCQVGQRDRFQEGLIRSGAWLDEIKAIFVSYGLPADLAYLPHVESSFNPHAVSKCGAVGIWQFTRSTGKRFMEIGYTVDERRDPIRASHAAARLLKGNYETLGDWPMAISAFNYGLSGMVRAQETQGTYEAIFKGYESRIFQFASRNFYSEFLAARDVAQNYQYYFGDLQLQKPLDSYEVVLAGYVPLKDLASHVNIDIAAIMTLNPSLMNPVFSGQQYIPKGYSLRLPVIADVSSEQILTELPRHIYKTRQKRGHPGPVNKPKRQRTKVQGKRPGREQLTGARHTFARAHTS